MIETWVRSIRERTDRTAFPGRLIGGASLILGPLVFLAGLVVRHIGHQVARFTPDQQAAFDKEQFAAPSQLAAYVQHPDLVTAGYALFALGAILMVPAIVAFAGAVARGTPRLAFWGGILFAFAMLARLYFAGVDRTAFQLVDQIDLQQTTSIVLESYVDLSYGLWRIPVTASAGSIVGAVLLAIGAFRSGVLGTVRCLLLVGFGWIWMGVLKEATLDSLVLGAVGAVVLVPLGIRVLRGIPDSAPTARRPLSW